MVLSKVSLIFWIICCYPLCLDIMAQNYSDSEEEFTGFSTEDINITNNYVPNSDPESDLTVSSVHSEDISDLGEESGGESGTDEIGEAEWTQNFGGITIENFTEQSGPNLPDSFDTAVATPLDYFELMFKPEMFEEIVTNTNCYVEYVRDQKWNELNDPNFGDKYWKDPCTVPEMRALFGVAILMGINSLPQAELHFDKNQFIGNTGIKKTFTVHRYKKLMQYLHVSDHTAERPRNDPNYDKLAKIRPMLEMVKQTFKDHYMPGKHQTIDEGMIAYKGRLSYMQYMPAKPIKRGIKVWLRCDTESAYMHQFDIYLGRRTNSPNGLGYDVVMKLCEQLRGKYHHVYFDNLFTSVPLLLDLLQQKTYACGTIQMNKRKLPIAVKHPEKMAHGAHKTFQFGNTNLVSTVWQDNKQVRVLSTNCDPTNVVQANRRIGANTVQVNQPKSAFEYNKYMGGVDRHDQLCMQYAIGRFSKKSWKYLMWFFVNASVVNAFILWKQCSTRETSKARYTHLDFHKEVACSLIAGFTCRKWRADAPLYVGPTQTENEANHESVHMGGVRNGK